MGVSPENEGSAAASLPHSSIAEPLRKIDPPMVMMMRLVSDTFLSGASVSRSSSKPTSVTMSTDPAKAARSGMPVPTSATAVIPPSMTNSPCAKLIASVAV